MSDTALSSPSVYEVPGLQEEVDVVVDAWGVPHIYAQSQWDVFVAQGFNAARDRLFQIDLWRRRGLGLLSEVFGSQYVERDRAARLFLYRGDMRSEWLAYGADTKQVASAFVAGVNAFVELTAQDPRLLPPEFSALGYAPSRWDPSDVARIRSHGLYYNVEQEVERARTLRDFGPKVESLRRVLEPAHEVQVPAGLDLSLIPDEVLYVYRLATSTPDLSVLSERDPCVLNAPEGSNNWVIGPSRTATGRPLLANDPHRFVTLPALRYIAHLNAPGLDVIGGGEPALPGVSIGHNGRIAFGLTIFAIDQEDLYVYRTNPDAPREYWYKGRWTPMEEVIESVRVSGGADQQVSLLFTRHGPVIYQDQEKNTAFAVRAAWLEPGMAPYLGSMDYMRSPSPESFVTAMNRWGAPGENQVYAAPDGTIGWQPAGLVPVRPNWDGTLPVPGDGRYEWAGFYDGDELPSAQNPADGWFGTANQMNLPADYPNVERTITYDWYADVRHRRMSEVIGSRNDWTTQDCVQLQCDYLSVPARLVTAHLDKLEDVSDPDVRLAVDLLSGWDCVLSSDSGPAALFEVWYRKHLRPRLLAAALQQVVEPARRNAALERILPSEDLSADPRVDLDLLAHPRQRLGANPQATIRQVLVESLVAAMGEVRGLLGNEVNAWRWGSLHRAHLRHPQAGLLSKALGEHDSDWTEMGPVPRGGSGDTLGCTTYSPDYVETVGASFRIAIDVGAWDNSLAVNSPGQSGVPSSPHYGDHFDTWARDEAFPLLYSRDLVEQHVSHRLRLIPESLAEPVEAVLRASRLGGCGPATTADGSAHPRTERGR
ncbi:penicillin acylase family protein [Leekyejoonella antrihumi]|uniref:Penicillin acylase family protein n=1 Tax=Leekyejoonella antrihumi TaxID=1660198 RepID=A0A563DWA0_9MICO|nr:penicillin acylase family protein [Leekyejoonella antrihumi]TWP34486.1 penicillin acylase family protein [Leekyejoonella antrihumi]